MSSIIFNPVSLLGEEYSLNKLFENDEILELKAKIKSIEVPSEEIFLKSIEFISQQDSFSLSVYDDSDTINLFTNNPEHVKKFLDEIIIFNERQELGLSFIVTKPKNSAEINIYNFETFYKTLNELSLYNIFFVINRVLKDREQITFNLIDSDNFFYSKSIFFVPVLSSKPIVNNEVDRKVIIDLNKELCHYENVSQFNLLPDDFKLIQKSTSESINTFFSKLEVCYSIVFLFDITFIKESSINYKLNGYKSISGSFNFNEIVLNEQSEYYNIYKWLYAEGGNKNDKVGLLRNIISLHLEKGNPLKVKGSAYSSILSSYEIYLKENIQQYITTRSKVSEELIALSKNINDRVENYNNNFQKSIIAVISFFGTILVIRILNSPNSIPFNKEATILTFVFIIVSFLYMIFLLINVIHEKEKYKSNYTNLKERYTDLLNSVDISKILNNDKDYNKELKYLNWKIVGSTVLWFITLATIFISVLNLSSYYTFDDLWNFFF